MQIHFRKGLNKLILYREFLRVDNAQVFMISLTTLFFRIILFPNELESDYTSYINNVHHWFYCK